MMNKKSGLITALIIVFFVLAFLVQAEETNESEFNETSVEENATENSTIVLEIAETNDTEVNESITDFELTSFTPKEFKINTDIQFNIQIHNTGNTELKNLIALVTGPSFSSSDVIPIDSLKADEKSYILVMGTFRQEGDLELTIRINDKTFKQGISVINPYSQEAKKLEEESVQKDAELQNLSIKLQELKVNFTALEKEYKTKKDNDFDLSEIKLDDLKKYLRDAESSIIAKDFEQVKIGVTLGEDEYLSLKDKIDNADKIKVPFLDKIRNNVIILSTIAASIITLFSFYEFMKKKKEIVSENIKSIKDKKTDSKEAKVDLKEEDKAQK